MFFDLKESNAKRIFLCIFFTIITYSYYFYFLKEQIGAVKARKKQFDNQTKKFCTSQERYLALSTKKPDTVLQEVIFVLFKGTF